MAKRAGDDNGDGLVIIYNMMANRSVPIVFILVSSLIIANISCDQVGSANELELGPANGFDAALTSAATTTKVATSGLSNGSAVKYDPLSILREIYLDHDSKIITFLDTPNSNSVQKFHPNGRYGRRSVDNSFADAPAAHMELAKLRSSGDGTSVATDEDGQSPSSPLRSLLQLDDRATAWNEPDTTKWSPLLDIKRRLAANGGKRHEPAASANQTNRKLESIANYRQELNKLLKCNYSGVSNLFWCDT